MILFDFFKSLFRKLVWVIQLIQVKISPIYHELVDIIQDVKNSDLKDDDARKEVFKRITNYMQLKGIKISDSILNCAIELVYQLIKNKKE